ncbi:hypothetical protein SUGI_0730620 [Cryptomeria japonica]|nr:hypothetical protein SUGI_0730620 [Cryptomeria japonica]
MQGDIALIAEHHIKTYSCMHISDSNMRISWGCGDFPIASLIYEPRLSVPESIKFFWPSQMFYLLGGCLGTPIFQRYQGTSQICWVKVIVSFCTACPASSISKTVG